MNTQAITPNWHVILIHYPLGLLSVGILIEIFSFLWKRSSVRVAGRWMILIGSLACIPAATSGLFAFRQAILSGEVNIRLADMWQKTRLLPQEQAFMRSHVLFTSIGAGILALMLVIYLGSSDRLRSRLYILHVLLLLAGMGCLTSGAWNAGESIYRHGTGVLGMDAKNITNTNKDTPGSVAPVGAPRGSAADDPSGSPAEATEKAEGAPNWQKRLEWAVPPVQLHVFLAGGAVALGVLALGLSIRAITESRPIVVDETWYETHETRTQVPGGGVAVQTRTVGRPAPAGQAGGPPIPLSGSGDLNDDFGSVTRDEARQEARQARHEMRQELAQDMGTATGPVHPTTPLPAGNTVQHTAETPMPAGPLAYAARWWALGLLLFLGAAASGMWQAEWFQKDMIKQIKGDVWPLHDAAKDIDNRRMFAHLVGGGGLVLISLILAILTRVSRRAKISLTVFSVLLVAAIAQQVWGGILLLYDTAYGPLTSFNPPAGQGDDKDKAKDKDAEKAAAKPATAAPVPAPGGTSGAWVPNEAGVHVECDAARFARLVVG